MNQEIRYGCFPAGRRVSCGSCRGASRAAARLVRRRVSCGSCGSGGVRRAARAARAAVAVFPKPYPRTSRERFEQAGAFGTRHDGTSTLSPRLKPGLRGPIRRNEAGFDAYQSGDTVLGGLGETRGPWARLADLGRDSRTLGETRGPWARPPAGIGVPRTLGGAPRTLGGPRTLGAGGQLAGPWAARAGWCP